MLAVDISSLNKVYSNNSKRALSDFNLKIEEGSFFALLGPNGAGKSTLINILAGLVRKTSGSVKVLGYDIDLDPDSIKFLIGVVPQELIIDTFFPLKRALEIHAGYYGISPKDSEIEKIIKLLNLEDKKNSLPRHLSGGMKRRFLVAKAMVHKPRLLILDEPTAGVDVELREHLWQVVKELNKNGTTVILTTHYLEEAEALCDRIAFINHGKILAEDTKENLLGSLTTRQINVEFASDIKNSISFPDDIKYNKLSNNKISIQFDIKQRNMGSALNYITELGLDISDISTKQPNIEDIFKKIMRGEV